jgi:hypothetical protein
MNEEGRPTASRSALQSHPHYGGAMNCEESKQRLGKCQAFDS